MLVNNFLSNTTYDWLEAVLQASAKQGSYIPVN